MSEEIFDFGFTLVDEDELDTVQEIEQKVSESSTTAEQTQDRLDKLFSAIQPLLNNLNKDSKIKIVESLWTIIYSDSNADMYENSLMRRLTGLLYLDPMTVGDIKKKVINNLK